MSDVEELGLSLQRFGWPDYMVFLAMLLVSAGIGIYFGFCVGKVSPLEYLMGGRDMRTFPVAMSLIASYTSGITLLGTPTEIYVYGTQYLYIVFAVVLLGVVMAYVFLPVFHQMRLASTYEYLEKRFNTKVRLLGSFLFLLATIAWLTLVVYLPALALNQVTGINVHLITPSVCAVCIFYTCVGGLQAVVWTDVLQTGVMFLAVIFVVVKGTIDVGGVSVVWERNRDSGRLETPNFSFDPYERHAFWVLLIGGFAFWLQSNAVNHAQMQRYLALPTLRAAQTSLSTGLNSIAAVVWEDFYKSFTKRQLTDRQTDILMKGTVIVMGCLCVALVFVVEKLGTVLQIGVSLCGLAYASSLGIFCMGLFLPWVTSTGALIGGIFGLAAMSWVNIGTEAAIASGQIYYQTKPVSVEMCTYNFTIIEIYNVTTSHEEGEVFPLYRISYLWYSFIGTLVTILVGLISSFLTGSTNLATLDPTVVSPLVRRWLPKRAMKSDQSVALLALPT